MRNKNNSILITLALICLIAAGLLYLSQRDPAEKNGQLNGFVFDAYTGRALAGVEVSSTNSDGKKYDSRENTDATRQDGSFSLSLPAGEYTVQFEIPGYEDYSSDESYSVSEEKTTLLEDPFLLTPEGASTESDQAEEEAAAAEAAAKKKAEEEAAAAEAAAKKKAEEEAAAKKKAEEEAAKKKAEEEAAAAEAAAKKRAEEEAAARDSIFSINPSQVEDYSSNLSPEYYPNYSSGYGEFFFNYPPNLYNRVDSDYTYRSTLLGHNIETHTFYGSKGSMLTFSLSDRSDSLNISSAKKKIFAQEAAEITDRQNVLLDEGARFVVTGYNSSGNIIYKLVKVTSIYIMEMRIECPPYRGQEDKLCKRYVQECIYRYCGFAKDNIDSPRSYSEFIKDKDNQ